MAQHWLYSIGLLIGLSMTPFMGNDSQAEDIQLHTVKDLESLAKQATSRNVAILLMFSANTCPYCTIMEENYLLPMLRSGEYKDKVIIRKIMTDDLDTLADFNGKKIEIDDLTSRYQAWVTPTLVFLNNQGQQIAPKLVGIGTEGFFAGDIDDAIDVALSHVRSVAMNQVK